MTTPTVDLNQWSAQTVMQWEIQHFPAQGDLVAQDMWSCGGNAYIAIESWHPLTNSNQAKEVARKVVEAFGDHAFMHQLGKLTGAWEAKDKANGCLDSYMLTFFASNEAILQACYLVYGQEK